MSQAIAGTLPARPNLDARPHRSGAVIFVVLLGIGLGYTLNGLLGDIDAAHTPPVAIGAFVLLGIALLIALGFEFVNGFHDTANAVATVIYTHSLPPHLAVVWSGAFNFLGVMVSSGAVAFSVVSLLPVELILQVGSSAGFAMIFALLIAAIVWNLGTWWLGLPASSSHTLIGSIIGVGLANQLMAPTGSGTSGVDWSQAMGVFRALLFSPVVGFVASALMLLAMRALVRNRALYEAPTSNAPPPPWIRGLLVLTCTGVSFAHGSNDGQKGMGLIMLILIGSVPTAFALNHAMPSSATPAFLATTQRAQAVFDAHAGSAKVPLETARTVVTDAVRTRTGAGVGDLGCARDAVRRHRRAGQGTWRDECHPCRGGAERAQRHVPGQRGDPPGAKAWRRAVRAGRRHADRPIAVKWTPPPSSSRPGSRWRWRSPSASAPWSDGSASSSPWARRSARAI